MNNHQIPFIYSMTENKYELVKVSVYPSAKDLPTRNEIPLSKHPAESVTILTAEDDEEWAWGYRVCWANGKTSCRNPTFRIGVFNSERTAILYAIGFMLSYADYFQPDTVNNIKAAERRYITTSLPFFDEL